MAEKFLTDMRLRKQILIITNDSTVFNGKNKLLSAFEMFGGRMTEVKNLVARLDTAVDDKDKKLCDVSFGVISSHYGFVPGNYMVTGYDKVMETKEDYIEVEEKKHYVEQIAYISRAFDQTILCIPKEMFRLFLECEDFDNKRIIAVTNPEFQDICKERGWIYLERKGARVGTENANKIEEIVKELCK